MGLAGREKSLGFLWFVVGAVLVGSMLWVAYDEAFGRRTWKKYAKQWEQMEVARIEKAIGEEKAKIDPNTLKQLQLEREQVTTMMESGEYKTAQKELQEAQNNYDDAKQQLQFTKADADETFYRWKHALHEKKDFEAYKKRYYELENQIKEYSKIEAEWEAKLKTAQAKVDDYDKKLTDLDERESKLYEKSSALERQLEEVKARGTPIEQVVINDIGKAGPVQWGAVDRCVSCHIPTLTPGYEEGKQPFQTHPHLQKIFDAHPYESYGCVTCHGGQGRATQIKAGAFEKGSYAHGFEKHWLDPLLRGDYIESSCNKCHVQQFTLDMAPVYSQGKEIFVEYGCINCHKIEGLDWAPKSGPSLLKIEEKVYPEWLMAWLKKPTDYLPHTKMPQVPWDDEAEILQTAAYIMAKSKPFNWKYGNYSGGGNVAAGEELFNNVGCMACHAIEDKGGDAGPALDRIVEKTNANWLYNWVKEPKNWSTHARMPSLRLTDAEANNLVAYLMTKGNRPAEDETLRAALQEQENIDAGFKAINKYGCYACHYIEGFEDMGRPSVALTNYGRKDPKEFAFGDADVPHTWEAYTDGKIKNPQMFVDERSPALMPKPNLTDEQRRAVMIFLRGQRPEDLPKEKIAYDPQVEKGRQLVYWYNCKQCHVIEGQGGVVSEWIAEPNFLPPNLASTGARLQTHWMQTFLKNPANYPKIRDWLKIRMPTYGFTDEEIHGLVQYFKTIAGVNTLLEAKPTLYTTPEKLAAGKELIGNNNFACASCHIVNGVRPAAGPTVWAPDLAYNHHRLRPEWVNQWIRNPASLIEGIRMPGYYPEPGSGPQNILGGNDDEQVQAIVDYLYYLGNPLSVVIQNKANTPALAQQEPESSEEESTEKPTENSTENPEPNSDQSQN